MGSPSRPPGTRSTLEARHGFAGVTQGGAPAWTSTGARLRAVQSLAVNIRGEVG